MFTEYTKEEIETPVNYSNALVPEHEDFKDTNAASDSNIEIEVKQNVPATYEVNNSTFEYNLEGESLW